jgi:disulfide bond formation protein DsbB
MTTLIDLILRRWLVLAFLASAAMLGAAHAFETFGHMAPCTLCLRQREIYWVALAASASGAIVEAVPRLRRFTPLFGAALALIFLYGVGIATWHAGAEWKWWPGPAACASTGHGVSLAQMTALLHGAKVTAPHCDEAAWRMLGLSMAGWNVLISLGLAAFSGLFAWRRWRGADV